MPTVKLSPVFNEQVVTSAGAPASGYLLYTYAAGSSTAQTTYTTSAGTVAQANPIVLNSNGATDNPIWLVSGQTYKFVLKDSGGVTIRTVDNVAGINDTSVSTTQWVSSGVTPTYVSASSFTLAGDQTSEFHVGRRVQCTVTAGTVYGVIATTAYTTLTTVTVTLDSGSLDAGLSAVNLSLLRADYPALPRSAAVRTSMGVAASGANTDITSLGAVTGVTAAQGNNSTLLATTAFVQAAAAPVGTVIHSISSTAPTGYLKANGQTIGSASSGATGRAAADAESLFTVIWNSTSNTDFVIQTSAGSPTTRGASASADFAANKRLPLPDLRGEFVRGLDDSRGVDTGRTMGSAQTDAFKSHTHTATYADTGFGPGGGGAYLTSTSGTSGATGETETRPRNIALMAYIRYL